LVTGGAGFIGSHFIRFVLKNRPDTEIINLDLLTYAGNLENLSDIQDKPRYRFIKGNIADKNLLTELARECGAIINFAAESHVDRSILGPDAFVQTNINGTFNLLEAARALKIPRFLQISTDEVYGALGKDGSFSESTPLAPNSPYSASKASADLLCRSYFHTFGMNVVITRCSNNYGPYQFPEKLIPLMIMNASRSKELPVYGDGLYVRDWIFVEDHCDAVLTVLENGKPGEVYNIGSNNEWTNLAIVEKILEIVGRPKSLIRFVKDRPGHDRRYAIDSTKISKELGWKPKTSFGSGLKHTVDWYLSQTPWLERVTSGAYQNYYRTQYENHPSP
jgi:dTDP-glucose 4,6-dehydratase